MLPNVRLADPNGSFSVSIVANALFPCGVFLRLHCISNDSTGPRNSVKILIWTLRVPAVFHLMPRPRFLLRFCSPAWSGSLVVVSGVLSPILESYDCTVHIIARRVVVVMLVMVMRSEH